jgi:hypothetical protein
MRHATLLRAFGRTSFGLYHDRIYDMATIAPNTTNYNTFSLECN